MTVSLEQMEGEDFCFLVRVGAHAIGCVLQAWPDADGEEPRGFYGHDWRGDDSEEVCWASGPLTCARMLAQVPKKLGGRRGEAA